MAESKGAGQGLSPIKVFLALLAVIVVIVGIVVATSGDEGENSFAVPEETPLSEQEASQELRDLLDRANEMFRDRDLSQLSSIYTSSSPVRSIATDEITQMINDNVLIRTKHQLLETRLISSSVQELIFRGRVRITPRFITEDGDDVTSNTDPRIQTMLWTLRKEEGTWRIHDSVIEAIRPAGEGE